MERDILMRKKLPDRLFTWYFLLNKRLLKKFSFILVLLSLPFLTFALGGIAKEESGVLHIALYQEDKEDALASAMLEELKSAESVIRFTEISSEEEGLELLAQSKIDAFWIIPKNIEDKIENYIKKKKPVLQIREREDSSVLRLSREKLYKVIFPHLSYSLYMDFMYKELGEELSADAKTKQRLEQYYEKVKIEGDLLHFALPEGDSYVEKERGTAYLLSPLRGMIAIWLVLCGFAAAMYFVSDLRSGLFSFIPAEHRIWISFAYQLSIMINAGLIMLAALFFSGVTVSFGREVLAVLLLIIAVIGFCNLLRLLLCNLYRIAAAIPFVLIVFLVLNPVFADIGLKRLQYLTPVFYYLNLIYSMDFLYPYLAYIAVLYLLNMGAELIGTHRIMGLKS